MKRDMVLIRLLLISLETDERPSELQHGRRTRLPRFAVGMRTAAWRSSEAVRRCLVMWQSG